MTTGQGEFTYVVDLVRTSDSPDVQIEQVPARLTLVTSDPAITPTRSLQVSAQLDGDPLPATTRQATVADDLPGEGSSGRQVSLLLWAQALLHRHRVHDLDGAEQARPGRALDRRGPRAARPPLAGLREPRRPAAQHPLTANDHGRQTHDP